MKRWCVAVAVCCVALLETGCGFARESGATAPRAATQAPAQVQQQTQSGNPAFAAALKNDLQSMIAAGQLSELRWPRFPDVQRQARELYSANNGATVWTRDGQPTLQARAIIKIFQDSALKGLNPEDYDAGRWAARLSALDSLDKLGVLRGKTASADDVSEIAKFDLALTISTMRYASALHQGRVNPRHFKFGIDIDHKKYDLAQFVAGKVATAQNVLGTLDEAEPQVQGYMRTEAALDRYLVLEPADHLKPLPPVEKTLAPGAKYVGAPTLRQLLHLLGDLPAAADVQANIANSDTYDVALAAAVKNFQRRHGLGDDGRLGKETIEQLNTPLPARITQLQDALERWRWLPNEYDQPPVEVNIPEFRLRTYSANGTVALRMNVIVGKSVRHQTPVFERDMKYVVFRPYWNVPRSILRSEIVPHIQKDRMYLAQKNYEVIDAAGNVVSTGSVSDAVLERLRAGSLSVRQKPGPNNALGLIKFMFPNEHSVYLHSTPAQQLFSQSRRDFSHGCIRVEKPAELAGWVLRNNSDNSGQADWTLEKIRAAMQSGTDNRQVNLTKPIPVLILYVTAVVEEDGEVWFFRDIYGHDKSLNVALAKGYPYPE